jgi:hypothetical protein
MTYNIVVQAKPKVTIITVNNLISRTMIKNLIQNHQSQIDSLIIVPNFNLSNDRGKRTTIRWFKTASFYFFYYKLVEIYFDTLVSRVLFRNIAILGKRNNIKVVNLRSQSEAAILEAIEEDGCDFLISMGHAILSKSIIATPSRLCMNVHGGDLPKYRGLSNYVWMLLENERFATVTLHELVEKIDAGEVIKKAAIEIAPDWSAFRLNFEMAKAQSTLVSDFFDSGYKVKFLEKQAGLESKYRGIPTPSSIKDLSKIGRKLIKISDLKLIFLS